MSFEGFSDFEIQKITTGRNRKHEVKLEKKIPCHTKPSTKQKQAVAQKVKNEDSSYDETTMTNKPPTENEFVSVPLNEEIKEPVKVIFPPEVDVCEDKNSKLQDFELQRKLMEEQNKMKRSLLNDAISKHTEKTQAEAKKLNEIRQALDVLDSELSNDVAILRKEIEIAALHFNNVEKHYNAVEKSFLKAKQNLYEAHEKKEMLTEHLYTIIAHNEDRKAKRLSELMEMVGLPMNENQDENGETK